MSDQDFFSQINQKQKDNLNKLLKRLKFVFLILLPIVIAGFIGFHILTNYIWMDTLGFESVYTTILTSRVALGVIGFVLFLVVGLFTLKWIHKSYLGYLNQNVLPEALLNKKTSRNIILIISIIFGVIGTMLVQGLGWEPALKLLNFETFGTTDPHFNLDVSFYVYILPFIEFVIGVLLSLSVIVLLSEIGAYSVFEMYRRSRSAQLHLGFTLGFIGLLLAAQHFLEPYGTLLTNEVNAFQNSVVHGLSYTDDVINIPKAYILGGTAILASIWMIISLIRGRLKGMIYPIATYIAVVILGQLASVAVQQFVVSPNEFSKEEPYLEHNLNYTRTAYNLDNINEIEHPGNDTLDQDLLERNQLTIDNVRINDARPLLEVYNQKQTFRTYYEYNDIDIDRYMIDGEYSQVFIGARELNTTDLPDQAKTWVNENLRYTHGYGVAMSHVNEIDSQGQPEFIMKNLPPEGSFDIERPQIYFGEEPYGSVIVNTEVDEFDYPAGEVNESTRFEADSGIPLQGLNKLLFAIKEGNFRMFISDQLTAESQLLQTRNIVDRVNRIAPFFEYDLDPYLFVREDGGLSWMMDGYLTAENFPYAEPYQGSQNYIRNSVKVTIDAYTGEVNFYASNPNDPLYQTYRNIFPDLFTDEVPNDVRAHFRYPEMLFQIQAEKYGTYHMSNLEVFYNREDVWQFPTEKYFANDTVMDPYYVSMKLPEEDMEEFLLTMPYSPKNRQNMIAWLGVRNDGDNYGEFFVYRFPKQKNVYGPQQIENRINQDSYISQELNLWSQGGSNVIRGNLLTIPIEDTVLYVEPIYIESSNQTSLPEVKQVVVAYQDYIVMEATFDQALDRILTMVEEGEPGNIPEEGVDDPEQQDPILNADQTLRDVSDLFEQYQNALSQGDWARAGEIMTEIENKLNETE
ncbi:UPF0182 family membrane protein [Tenuibacillus multivorans]|uniref:UPF0182 protein SAMN05216498_3137 n=1 Tax=Tenuibacillus multivorans TaxID=237069 RepID=A0A1H0EG70_9BACI|nr:UPF0182 family protein [Tenuibacillus multivorans]GEL77173.1 UPF0182 protein [Tenuibacillus multivorans]SDN81320.1 hypothetical protein SAMN05216498_3137 [Tenuibacillus multivorans]